MRILCLSAAMAALASPAAGAQTAAAPAATPVIETMTCPIGGGSFSFTTATGYTTSGERPDGKPYGSWNFPLALPECPDNGLILYKDYTAEEIAKLEPIIASEAYRRCARRHALLTGPMADEGDGSRPGALPCGRAAGELGGDKKPDSRSAI